MTLDHCPESPQGHRLADLFRHHADGLAGAVRGVLGQRADVQEILQEAFLRAFRSLQDGFAPRHPVAWMFVITMNLAKDQRRKEQRNNHAGKTVRGLEDINPMELQSKEPGPTAGLEQAEAVAAAQRAIHELRPQEREVFLLRTSAGLSFQEAADALSIPIGTAKTRMRSALARLRQRLVKFAGEPVPRPLPQVPTIRPVADTQERGRRQTS